MKFILTMIWQLSGILAIDKHIHFKMQQEITGILRDAYYNFLETEQPSTPEDPFFILYSKTVNEVDLNDSSLYLLNGADQVTFIVHDWQGNPKEEWVGCLVRVLLERGRKFVIVVDWSQLASTDDYIKAMFYAHFVGKSLSHFIQKLSKEHAMSQNDVRLIGYGLGAHTCGVAGRATSEWHEEGNFIREIVGLDPNGPGFEGKIHTAYDENKFPYLTLEDAAHVLAIHTDAGSIGIIGTVGNADIYINGGIPVQPPCLNITSSCSHRQSHKIYTSALQIPVAFVATKCKDFKTFMLGECDSNLQISIHNYTTSEVGKYFLQAYNYDTC